MKKFIIILLVLALFISFIGCTSNTQPEQSNQTQSQTQTQTFKIGDRVKLGDYYLTVHNTEDNLAYNDYSKPKDDFKYYAVEITIENMGNDAKSYNELDFTIQDSNGYSYDSAIWISKEPKLSSGDLQPSRKVRGWVTFEISKNAQGLELIYQPDWLDSGQIIVKL